ncbi:MAG: hypothetical protein K6A43_08415 [Treponema sp.]|nr:hypothetical protein [Treponema sp.]
MKKYIFAFSIVCLFFLVNCKSTKQEWWQEISNENEQITEPSSALSMKTNVQDLFSNYDEKGSIQLQQVAEFSDGTYLYNLAIEDDASEVIEVRCLFIKTDYDKIKELKNSYYSFCKESYAHAIEVMDFMKFPVMEGGETNGVLEGGRKFHRIAYDVR